MVKVHTTIWIMIGILSLITLILAGVFKWLIKEYNIINIKTKFIFATIIVSLIIVILFCFFLFILF